MQYTVEVFSSLGAGLTKRDLKKRLQCHCVKPPYKGVRKRMCPYRVAAPRLIWAAFASQRYGIPPLVEK